MAVQTVPGRTVVALFVLCTSIYLWTAPGRIQFPDDEIVYQTTASLYERGTLDIPGIAKPSGEPEGRPRGTFGWEYGRDHKRYGFFGHGLSLVALPAYALGNQTYDRVPHTWRHAVRSNHYFFHTRSAHADWTRLVVSLTNCVVTGLAVAVFALWLSWLGFTRRVAVTTSLMYGLGTCAWPFSRTFLSEPLSGLLLVATAASITWFHRARARGDTPYISLWLAGALAGFSVHTHILNLTALPALLGYALIPLWRARALTHTRRAWVGGLLLGSAIIGLWLYGQYWRFGDPFETGRFGYYSHSVLPFEAMAAQLIAPGRSVFVYAPAILLGLWGLRSAWRRIPAALWMALSVAGLRYLMISTRSDWWGGWAIGPRHLVPVVAFLLLPLASALQELRQRCERRRITTVLWCLGLLACVGLSGYLACFSIFEWMWTLMIDPDVGPIELMDTSHWQWWASPYVGFAGLEVDMLSAGAKRLHAFGHVGLLNVFRGIGVLAAAAACILAWDLRGRSHTNQPENRRF